MEIIKELLLVFEIFCDQHLDIEYFSVAVVILHGLKPAYSSSQICSASHTLHTYYVEALWGVGVLTLIKIIKGHRYH